MGVDLLPNLSGEKDWSPEKWSPRHRIVVALHLGGDKNKEIAEKLGLSESRVSIILNDPRAAHEIMRMSAMVADRTVDTALRIKLYANEALDEIVEELRTSRSEKIRQNAAFGLLDRAGFTPPKINGEEKPPMSLPEEVVDRMENATNEIIQHAVKYRNIEPVEEEKVEAPEAGEIAPGAPRGPQSGEAAEDGS